MNKPTIAISLGDINGVGLEIAIKSHTKIATLCHPIYAISKSLAQKGATQLGIALPSNMTFTGHYDDVSIVSGEVTKESGAFSYRSFITALDLCDNKKADAVVTLPIHKEAWSLANLHYKGHTDMLRERYQADAIMMLGCEKLYVALFTEHIPLKEVASKINTERIYNFLCDLYSELKATRIGVLGLNPHAGDNGVLGDEERFITQAIQQANNTIGHDVFHGPLVPDIAFTPHSRLETHHFVAMYHDQGLAPLKALYFDESINVSLNLPIIRTSVDHGTAFDIAYKMKAKTESYHNAIAAAISLNAKKITDK